MTKRFIGNLKTFGASSGYSVALPGSTATYLQMPWSYDIALSSNNFTLEAWIYPLNSGTQVGIITGWGATSGQYILRRTAGNRLEFVYNNGATVTLTGTVGFIRPFQWNHVCVIGNTSSNLRLYINGVVSVSTGYPGPFDLSDTTPLRIGVDQNITNAFLGYISNVRFCMTDVSAASNIYNNDGFNPPTTLFPTTTDCKFLTCNSTAIQNITDNTTFRQNVPVTVVQSGTPVNIAVVSDFSPATSEAPLSYPNFGPGTANYQAVVAIGSTGNVMGLPTANSTINGSANLGMLTLNDAAMSAAQGNLSNYDPTNTNNLDFTRALIKAGPIANNNNTFIDSSSINATPTRVGNVNQGTKSPYYQRTPATAWSSYLNNGAWHTCTTVAPGTGSCTYEWFFNLDVLDNPTSFINTRSGDTTDGFDCYIDSGGQIRLSYTGTEFFVSTAGGWVRLKKWTHMAIVWNGTALSVYIDGVAVAPSPLTVTSRTFSSTALNFPNRNATGGGTNFRGYMTNFRYCTSAVYTTGFTPPVPPLPVVTSSAVTRLLTLQDYFLVDNSGNNNITLTDTNASLRRVPASVLDNQLLPPPDQTFIGGSGWFDGTGDYLTYASSTNYAPGTGDFSWEMWFCLTTKGVLQDPLNNSAGRWGLSISTGNVLTTFDGTTTFTITTGRSPLSVGSWYHVAITRVGTQIRCFLNGRLTATAASTYTSTAAQTCNIGCGSTVNTNLFRGYITGVRFVKGGIPSLFSTASTTVGTQIFTPSLTPYTGTEALTGGTVNLLMRMDNYGVADARGRCNFETLANYTNSATVTKFGNKSMYFDGSTTGYMQGLAEGNFTVGSFDFCIDLWFYPTSLAAVSYLLDINNANATGRLTLRVNTDGTVQTTGVTLANIQTTTINALSINRWYHIAVVRSSSRMAIYIDGVASITPAVITTSYNSTVGTYVAIGGVYSATFVGGACNGYMQDLRVTQGHSRFSSGFVIGDGFTPPEGPAAVQ
jgi:hypothetical protein